MRSLDSLDAEHVTSLRHRDKEKWKDTKDECQGGGHEVHLIDIKIDFMYIIFMIEIDSTEIGYCN